MQVTVHYHGQLRRAAGRLSQTVEVQPGVTVAELLPQLGQHQGDAARLLLLDAEGRLHKSLLVFVREQQADASRILDNGDEVTILAPMSGGAP